MEESTYYLKVYNGSNDEQVSFTLNLSFSYPDPDDSLNTISGNEYSLRANWTFGYLYAGETHWYQLNVFSASYSVYIHWQDKYDYDVSYSQPSADIEVSVYAADKTTLISSAQDSGYSDSYTSIGTGSGIGLTGATRYWVKVEGYYTTSSGYYYLSAIQVYN